MRILAIETATSRQSVAILDGERVVAQADQEAGGAHVKLLVPTIDRLLDSRGLSLRDLDGLAVSIGPGSFTGLRVGLATALAFRLVTGLPIVTVPTLEGLAWNVRDREGPICPILKARTGEVYSALYRWTKNEGGRYIQRLSAERVSPPSSVGEALVIPTMVLGDGWLAHREEILAHVPASRKSISEAPEHAMFPSAVSIALASQARLARGDLAGVVVVPLYVQRPAAELPKKSGEKGSRSRPAGGARAKAGAR
jgi:tRNA threonylcarbamoyladenosine biosynthesis protein TsaB